MPMMTVRRDVTRSVTEQQTVEIDVQLQVNRRGSVEILLNGEKALRITTSGYLRRLPGLSAGLGVRLLPDGKIAIKSAQTTASSDEDSTY